MKAAKDTPKITLSIQPGSVSPAMRMSWKKWWGARIAEVKQSEARK